MTLDQFQRWLAYYRVEPFGEDWLRTARLAAVTASAMGGKVDDKFEEKFLPGYNPNRVMTDEEIMAELMKIPGAKIEKD